MSLQHLPLPAPALPAAPRPYDRVIGNPPFSTAEAHVERALQVAAEVVYLLPVSRLETPSRQAYYASTPLRSVTLLGERVWPGSRQIGLFWWDCCHQGTPTLDFASWRTP